MGAREFRINEGEMLKIDALEGDSLRVRSGDVWVTQHGDSKDYLLKAGDAMILSGKGATLAVAYKPTLLDLYRSDPAGTREQILREAKRAQARAIKALFRRILAGIRAISVTVGGAPRATSGDDRVHAAAAKERALSA